MYGYIESKELQFNPEIKFGLNTGIITKFEYNPNGGKGKSKADAFDISISFGEKELNTRYFDVKSVKVKGEEITDPSRTEFQRAVNNVSGDLIDYAKIFVPEEKLKQIKASSFVEFVQVLEKLVKSSSKWGKQNVDVFLQHQYSDPKYLEIANNSLFNNGFIVCEHIDKDFKEEITSEGLRYVTEDGEVHPITRNANWVKTSKNMKGNQPTGQTVGQSPEVSSSDQIDDLPF